MFCLRGQMKQTPPIANLTVQKTPPGTRFAASLHGILTNMAQYIDTSTVPGSFTIVAHSKPYSVVPRACKFLIWSFNAIPIISIGGFMLDDDSKLTWLTNPDWIRLPTWFDLLVLVWFDPPVLNQSNSLVPTGFDFWIYSTLWFRLDLTHRFQINLTPRFQLHSSHRFWLDLSELFKFDLIDLTDLTPFFRFDLNHI